MRQNTKNRHFSTAESVRKSFGFEAAALATRPNPPHTTVVKLNRLHDYFLQSFPDSRLEQGGGAQVGSNSEDAQNGRISGAIPYWPNILTMRLMSVMRKFLQEVECRFRSMYVHVYAANHSTFY